MPSVIFFLPFFGTLASDTLPEPFAGLTLNDSASLPFSVSRADFGSPLMAYFGPGGGGDAVVKVASGVSATTVPARRATSR